MIQRPTRLFRLPLYLRREALTLTLLTAFAGALFAVVSGLSGLYRAQQESLAARWSSRGELDLKQGNYKDAAEEFRGALRYSQDAFEQQLDLAQALIGLKRNTQAKAYLVNLWAQQPENGLVNLQLARIAAGEHDTRLALRYYHNAIYAIWSGDAETARRNARWELIKYLLSLNAKADAQSELISLAAEVGDDPVPQTTLGQYFLNVQDDFHALAAFRRRLEFNPRDAAALAGAGEAAFGLGDYSLAQRFLERAVQANPSDRNSAVLLQTASLVKSMDPFRERLSDAGRAQAMIAAFNAAGDRLKACTAADAHPIGNGETLGDAWQQLHPKMTRAELERHPEIESQAMDLVFAAERQAGIQCGAGSPQDTALLLISKMHEGS